MSPKTPHEEKHSTMLKNNSSSCNWEHDSATC